VKSMKLLYIEDSSSDVDLTRRALTRAAPEIELTVVTTLNAAEAVLGQPHNFELLLVDLHLPDGSGFEILNYVRDRNLPLSVVILTSAGDQQSAITAIKLGADDYLPKKNGYLERLPDILNTAITRFRNLSSHKSQSLNVLFVEQNQAELKVTMHHLAQNSPHIRLTTVANAEEALTHILYSSLGKVNFDVLLVNYHLPGMDGLESS
jgi:CheY-like chemotaxis protein